MRMVRPLHWKLWFSVGIIAVIALGMAGVLAETTHPRVHNVVFQVNSDDAAPMKHAISNSMNLVKHYREKGEAVKV